MALATLTIDIDARMASIEKDMNKVASLSEQTAARMSKAFAAAGPAIAALFAADSARRLIQGFADITNQLDALNDAADATGSSIENLSALEDIGKRTGTAFEDVTSILFKFNAVLKDADGKNGASMALKAIGLDAEALKRIDPAEALRLTAVALSKYANDGNKARLFQEIFGKSAKEAAAFVKELAEAGKLNAAVTAEQTAEAERFNKHILSLQTNLSGLGRTIVSEVLPGLNRMIADLNDGQKAYGSFLGAAFDIGLNVDPFLSLDENLSNTVARLKSARKELEDARRGSSMVSVGGALAKGDVHTLQNEIDRLEKREMYLRNKTYAERDAAMSAYVPRRQYDAPSVPALESATTKARGAATSTKDDAAARYISSLTDQINKVNELGAVELANFKLSTDLKGKATPAEDKKIRALAEEIELLGRQETALSRIFAELDAEAKATQEARRAAAAEAEQEANAAARYFDASLTTAEKLRAQIKEINDLYDKGAFKTDDTGTAEDKRTRALGVVNDQLKAQDDRMKELSDSAKSFSDIMLNAIQNGGDLGEALEQIAMKSLIFDPLSDALSGLFKDVMGGGGAGGGGILGALFGGFFADGGSPPVGKVSVVGERGPELFVPQSAGTIIPNKALSSMGGQAVNITQHITIGEGVSANGVMSAMQASKEMAKAEVMQILRGRGMPV